VFLRVLFKEGEKKKAMGKWYWKMQHHNWQAEQVGNNTAQTA